MVIHEATLDAPDYTCSIQTRMFPSPRLESRMPFQQGTAPKFSCVKISKAVALPHIKVHLALAGFRSRVRDAAICALHYCVYPGIWSGVHVLLSSPRLTPRLSCLITFFFCLAERMSCGSGYSVLYIG